MLGDIPVEIPGAAFEQPERKCRLAHLSSATHKDHLLVEVFPCLRGKISLSFHSPENGSIFSI
jgi:hypothetical protein